MDLEKQIFEQIEKRMDLDPESLANLKNDTLLFDLGDERENLGLDSIDALELITILYDTWKIDVPTEDLKKLYSIDSIAAYVREHTDQ